MSNFVLKTQGCLPANRYNHSRGTGFPAHPQFLILKLLLIPSQTVISGKLKNNQCREVFLSLTRVSVTLGFPPPPQCPLTGERTFGRKVNQVSLFINLDVLVAVCCNQSESLVQVSKCLLAGWWKNCHGLSDRLIWGIGGPQAIPEHSYLFTYSFFYILRMCLWLRVLCHMYR